MVVMSGYSGPHGTGRIRQIPEEQVMGTTEPSWQARSPLPILEPWQARPALESDTPSGARALSSPLWRGNLIGLLGPVCRECPKLL